MVGDCLLDVAVRPHARPAIGGDVGAAIQLGAGGQAANLAVRLARRGRRVRLVAPVGRDAVGELLCASLAADGIELAALPVEASGAVVALIGELGERTMYSDRCALDAAAAAAAAGAAHWIHVSGYALLGDRGRQLAELLAGRFVSVNGGSAAAHDGRAPQLLAHLRLLRPALAILNAAEAAALLDEAAALARDAAPKLARELMSVVVVTDGARGAVVAWPDGRSLHAAAARSLAIDATGAGDAFAAALIDELANGPWPPDEDRMRRAMVGGAQLAARVVAVVGAQTRVEGERDVTVPA